MNIPILGKEGFAGVFLNYTDAVPCHHIQSQLDKLYVWAVTFPPFKYSKAIIQQIALGYK